MTTNHSRLCAIPTSKNILFILCQMSTSGMELAALRTRFMAKAVDRHNSGEIISIEADESNWCSSEHHAKSSPTRLRKRYLMMSTLSE